jgi:hypothetical protein
MKINQIIESTTAGSVASVAMPLGNTQKRAGSLFKGKKTKKKFYEGKMKDLAHDLEYMSPTEFKKKYGQTKDEVRQSLKEEEIKEQDLIVVPGMRKSKDSSFIPHEKDRRDHEVEMARSELYAAAKDAMRIYKMIKDRSEDQGLMGWQQSYITLASDYLNSVADSLEHDAKVAEMTGGVIAGGMSNFEESRPYNPLDYERREQSAMDQERRDFKRREMDAELAGEEERARKYNQGPWYVRIDGKLVKDKNKQPYTFDNLEVARKAAQTMMKKDWNQGKQFSYSRSPTDKTDVAEEKCVECGGPSYSEESIAEAKDACYNKVKSRYKVWPSAYASGALVKCRKVGAKNWGNKSK